MSAQQFMEMLFGKLPEFFKDEAELRALWSAPDTRAKLLQGLAEKGFGRDQMAEMQKIIDAEKSDLFDVLAHVAYALPPLTREERAAKAKVEISTHFNTKQQVFLDFVLSHYVQRRRRRTGPGETDAPAPAQISQLHRRCRCRSWADPRRSARSSRASRSISIRMRPDFAPPEAGGRAKSSCARSGLDPGLRACEGIGLETKAGCGTTAVRGSRRAFGAPHHDVHY